MRTTIVSSRDFDMKDWRAEHYMPPTEETIREAKIAGFKDGATGRLLQRTKSQFLSHGREEVRAAYIAGRDAGSAALGAFLAEVLR